MRSDLIYIPDSELDALIQQDTPYLDLTTLGLDIGDEPGSLSFYTREACVLCCTEEVSRILTKLGLSTAYSPHRHTDRRRRAVLHLRAASATYCTRRGRSASPAVPLFRCCHKGKKYAEPGAGDLACHLSDNGTGAFSGNKALVTKAVVAGGVIPPHGTLGNCSHL